jgi:hypothetical protein
MDNEQIDSQTVLIKSPVLAGTGAKSMSKERKSNKEEKKKPSLSPKEKKAAKKAKKNAN